MAINIGKEMALPMEQIIGGPMQALIKAQTMAASETASFINNIGIKDGKAQMVEFTFDRKTPKAADGLGTGSETVTLSVPLLTIVPVPFVRIEEATIDFECKVASSTISETSSSIKVDASASGKFWGVSFSVKASYARQSSKKETVDKSATLAVHVKVVQDEIPGGLARMLDILETAVTDEQLTAA